MGHKEFTLHPRQNAGHFLEVLRFEVVAVDLEPVIGRVEVEECVRLVVALQDVPVKTPAVPLNGST